MNEVHSVLQQRKRRSIESRLISGLREELRRLRIKTAVECAEKLLAIDPCAESYEALICPIDSNASGIDRRVLYTLLDTLRSGNEPIAKVWLAHLKTMLLERLEWPEEALRASEPLVGISKKYGWMRHNRGLMLSNLRRDFALAREEFKVVMQSAPRFWKAQACISEMYLCENRSTEAINEMNRCVDRLDGFDKDQALAWRGEMKLWVGRYEDALPDLNIQADRKELLALCWRGGARKQLGRFHDAIADLTDCLEVFPRDAEALVWRAEAFSALGRLCEARRDLDASIRFGGEPIWALINRALLNARESNESGFWSDFDRLPHRVVSFFEWQLHRPIEHDIEKGKELLEAILSAAKGIRRCEQYLYPVWMNAAFSA